MDLQIKVILSDDFSILNKITFLRLKGQVKLHNESNDKEDYSHQNRV